MKGFRKNIDFYPNLAPIVGVVGLVGLAALVLVFSGLVANPASAAPPAAPTPITVNYSPDGNFFPVISSQSVTADVSYEVPVSMAGFEYADVQYLVDHGTPNTTTVTIQFSNDKVNWVSGPAVISASATDTGSITRFPLFGRYTRFLIDVDTADPVIWTINVLAK
jgi:hypothetical protein